MAVFHDPRAPQHRVVFGGVEFVGGLTADINPDEGTRRLFEGAGIVEVETPAAEESKLSPKEQMQAEAAALGLDTEGTKAEIQARIDEHTAAAPADDPEE